jgi:hypothetical protein
MNLTTIAQVLAVILLAGWTVFKEVKDRIKRKQWDLAPNPKICKQHAEAIEKLQGTVEQMDSNLCKVAEKVGVILE